MTVVRVVWRRIRGLVYQIRHGREDMAALYGSDPNGLRSGDGLPPVGNPMISGPGGPGIPG